MPILQKTIDEHNVDTYIEPFCLSKNQQVYTKNGIKTIEELQVGDYIYDDNCQLTKVIRKIQSPKTKGRKISLKGNVEIICTDDHKFYLNNGEEVLAKDLKIKDELLVGTDKQIDSISSLDMSQFITCSTLKNGRSGKVLNDNSLKLYHTAPETPRFIPITVELMRCYGLIVAEGDKSNITMHMNEQHYLEEFITYYEKILNITTQNNKKYYINKERKSCQLTVPYKKIYEKIFFDAMGIGDGAHNKNISFLFSCPSDLCLEAIKYMHIGDGCIIKKGKYRNWSYKTSSKELAYQLQTLLSIKFNIKSTLSTGINHKRTFEGRVLNESVYYNVSVTKNDDITFLTGIPNTNIIKSQKSKGFYITKIKENFNDIFYDITVDNKDHCFILDGGIVTHNCGGANIIDKIQCKNRYGYDRSDTLIALLT